MGERVSDCHMRRGKYGLGSSALIRPFIDGKYARKLISIMVDDKLIVERIPGVQ